MAKLYLQIRDFLLEQIRQNKDNPDYRLPSENFLANKFKASRCSVRHAFSLLESKNYIYKIQGKGTYINKSLPDLSDEVKQKVIELIIPHLNSNHSCEIISGIQKFCSENFYDLSIKRSDGSVKNEVRALKNAYENSKGIILFPTDNNEVYSYLIGLSSSKFPMVLIDRKFSGVNFSCVATDNREMLYASVRLLHAKGFRNPVFFTFENTTLLPVLERNQGFTQGMLDFYGRVEKQNLVYLNTISSLSINDKYAMPSIKALLKECIFQNKNDAVILPDGNITLEFIEICAEQNLKIGKDIAVLLIDKETDSIFKALSLRHFIACQHSFEIGYTACGLLHDRIQKKDRTLRDVKIPPLILES